MDYSSFIGSQLFSVKDRTCIVTGGGTGIGKGMAAALTLNGAKETANELTDAAASAQSGGQCIPIEGDVATKKGVSDVYEKIVNLTDRNDPVGLEEQLWSIEDSDFANMTAIHCAGPYFLAVKCIPLFKNSDNPSVCNITSLAAHFFNRAVCEYSYGQSKAAEVHLTRLMAAGLLPYKIRCNSVCPGLFRSQLTTGTADPDAPLWPPMQRATEEAIPARRAGKWEEIAGAVLMLASPAGAYFNEAERESGTLFLFTNRHKTDGQEVVIDGGWRLVSVHQHLHAPRGCLGN
ncbi:Hypothetical protein CGB_G2340W [Cryptococcus gattii WM276]|uniref:3-oxoacyl-[acyl-carrier-protein] reductase n=2 Tax=Cryptococcus gattii TaxID=37769 RepID=E6R998_CRYGW|nr:Hypothetical protein CGB_G2340W [Cryptococcus gattii WM276]ADV23382.1 Hypothetical protein CGB_G2340W [Cryptococcus gattii WM276]KIR77787.1 hypothetical protein I306_05216 [Cryptococcus gattii EJB2]KJE01461.1 hypothetical protein I311_04877 [Cryptococcus gattii NT-10]